MRAVRLFEEKLVFADGAILHLRLWRVPRPVEGSDHDLKYALFYGRPGERLVLYDNERTKGDHRHRATQEEPYAFESVERLIEYFLADVRRARGGEG